MYRIRAAIQYRLPGGWIMLYQRGLLEILSWRLWIDEIFNTILKSKTQVETINNFVRKADKYSALFNSIFTPPCKLKVTPYVILGWFICFTSCCILFIKDVRNMISMNLKELRERYKYTQEEVAEKLVFQGKLLPNGKMVKRCQISTIV